MENNELVKRQMKITKIISIPVLLSIVLFAIGNYTANKNLSYLGGFSFLVTAGVFLIIKGYYSIFKKINPISTTFIPIFGFDNLPKSVITILGILFMLIGGLLIGLCILALIKLFLILI